MDKIIWPVEKDETLSHATTLLVDVASVESIGSRFVNELCDVRKVEEVVVF